MVCLTGVRGPLWLMTMPPKTIVVVLRWWLHCRKTLRNETHKKFIANVVLWVEEW